jgi:hypothetical protein
MHRRNRSLLYIFALAAAVFAAAGCASKPEPTPTPAADGGAPAAPTAAGQGKVSSGADPDKAPPYPGMYGKPAGS